MNSPIEPVSKDTLKSSCLRLNAKLDVKMATANPRQLFSPTLRAIVAIVQQKRQGIYCSDHSFSLATESLLPDNSAKRLTDSAI